MAKVLFITPVTRGEDAPRHVPYGMALLASIAIREGHLVQIFDANAWRASDAVLAQVLRADRWDVIALGGITTASRSMKDNDRPAEALAPPSPVAAGGWVMSSATRFIP